jgi:hypothetical protein
MAIDIKTTNLQKLMQQELTRKQFLQVVAVLLVSVLGFGNLVNMLTRIHAPSTSQLKGKSKNGFGNSKFGV